MWSYCFVAGQESVILPSLQVRSVLVSVLELLKSLALTFDRTHEETIQCVGVFTALIPRVCGIVSCWLFSLLTNPVILTRPAFLGVSVRYFRTWSNRDIYLRAYFLYADTPTAK